MSQGYLSRLDEEEIFAIFDVIEKGGSPQEAGEVIHEKLYLPKRHRKTVTAVFNVGIELSRRDPNAPDVLSTKEADEIAEKAGYGVSRSRVVELHRLYRLWVTHRSERAKKDVTDVATKRFEEEIRARVEPKQQVHVEPKEFLPLLHRWREQAQVWWPDEFLRYFYLRDLAKELQRCRIDTQWDEEIYEAAKRHHVQAGQRAERMLLQVEQEGLFRRLRQCYPDDAVWEAQDSWGRMYAAYLGAFISWCGDISYYLESFLALLSMDELPQGGGEVANTKDFLRQLKKDANSLVFLRLASLGVCCNLLTLGIAEVPSHLTWFLQADKLEILRDDTINQIAKLPKGFSSTTNEIGKMAKIFWERLTEVKENTRELLHKLQQLQAAHEDLHSKLTALELRLYGVTESQSP